MRVDLTAMQVKGIMLHLADQFAEDEQLKLDTLEGETDLFVLVSRLLDGIEADEGDKAALKEQVENRKARIARADKRIEARRAAIMALMQCAELDKLPLPEATLSLRTVPAKLSVNDAAGVPEGFCTMKPIPNMEVIKSAFAPDSPELPNWLRVEPERPGLTIRRK